MYTFFLNFLSCFVFSEKEANLGSLGYVLGRLTIPILLLHVSIECGSYYCVPLNGFLGIIVLGCQTSNLPIFYVAATERFEVEAAKSIDKLTSLIIMIQTVLTLVILSGTYQDPNLVVVAPDEINAFSKSAFFHEKVLSKEELISYWKEKEGALDVSKEISEDFLKQQHDLRVFFLKNPQVCIVGVPEPYMGAFEATRGLTRLLWSVPQAWYHERMHSCKIGLSFSHGDNDHIKVLSSKRASKGHDSARWIAAEDMKKAFSQIDLVFITCRGDKQPFYEGDFILDHESAIWWSTEKGRSTSADWLWHVYNNGNLQKFVDMYRY